MKTLVILLLILLHSSNIYCQGFYCNDEVFLNKRNITRLGLHEVTASSNDPSGGFHPLNNFVFEYRFDTAGEIIYVKHWSTWLNRNRNNKILNVTLAVDSAIENRHFKTRYYKTIEESKTVEFNQYKERTNKFMTSVLRQFEKMSTPQDNHSTFFIGNVVFLIDTVLLGKNVSIPQWLVPSGDSVLLSVDTIRVFKKSGNSFILSEIVCPTKNGGLEIDWMLDGVSEIWRRHLINELGQLEEMRQNVHVTKYYYNSQRLHIGTDTGSFPTIFEYK